MKSLFTILTLALASPAFAQAPTAPTAEDLKSIQSEVLRRIGAAVYMDATCKVLKAEDHKALEAGLENLRKDATTGTDKALLLSARQVKDLDKESRDSARETSCGPIAEAEVQTALQKVNQYTALNSPQSQEALKYFKFYGQMKILNEKCHFYNDEMTAIFATKRDEQGEILKTNMPKAYEAMLLPGMEEMEANKGKLPAEACTDATVQQMVTMLAWKATDTFASAPVAAPDCKANARCDLPSKLLKK